MKKRMTKSLSWVLIICMMLLLLPVKALATSDDNFKKATAISFDSVSAPKHDYSRANKLPMTGYFEKSFSSNGEARTAKVYISSGAPIRSYFTVIAVPDGVDTEEFMVKSGWKALVDEKQECLFVLEPSKYGWGTADAESDYLMQAMNFFVNPVDPIAAANNDPNRLYFSIFGEHYLVGYGNGAPALEAWAAQNPLKVIGQVYVASKGLKADYFEQFSSMEFGGKNANYNEIIFPDGFKKITYDQVVLPTWYINPDKNMIADSLAYWKKANDCVTAPIKDKNLGDVYKQKEDSDRWMTSYSGPISKVAVSDKRVSVWNDNNLTGEINNFLTYYTRYENAVAYGNQLVERADYAKLGIQIKTMMVNGYIREYMVYVPDSANKLWGDKAPALFVFPGDSQTDKVFLDATQWWEIAQDKGFILTIICEQYNSRSVAVSHKDNEQFFKQLREEILKNYGVDAARIYATGQSAGSMVTQSFAVAKPESFAAVASTSAAPFYDAAGNVSLDGVTGTPYPSSNKMIPTYMIYGAGDLGDLKGDLWDTISNKLDTWAAYHLGVNGFELGNGADNMKVSGWADRFHTWTWSKDFGGQDIGLVKLTRNSYRSHNCIYEEMPMLWDFLEHFSFEVDANNNVTRYYSPSGFRVTGDKLTID